jgi:hypothetical protein
MKFKSPYVLQKISLAICFVLISGCTQTQIYHPSKSLYMYDIDKNECSRLVTQSNPAQDDSVRQCNTINGVVQCAGGNDQWTASVKSFQNSLRAMSVNSEIEQCLQRRGWSARPLSRDGNSFTKPPSKVSGSTLELNMECQTNADCRLGWSCRSKKGGGTECR